MKKVNSPKGKTHTVSVQLPDLVANATTYYGVMAVGKPIRVKRMDIAFQVIPASAAGTVLANVINYDKSATADDVLNETADFDLETLTNKEATEIPEQATTLANINDIIEGDYIFLKVVSNNGDMTDGSGGCLTITFEEVPGDA